MPTPSKIYFGSDLIYSGGSAPEEWKRPSDWLPMPAVAKGEQKIVGLFAVYNTGLQVVQFMAEGDYLVDWGDGSPIEKGSSSTYVSHTYDYAKLAGTDCSRGYRQALITITPQPGNTLTQFETDADGIGPSFPSQASCNQWLDVVCGPPLEQWSASRAEMLERVTLLDSSQTSSLSFSGCSSLESLPNLDTSSVFLMDSMFAECMSLRQIPSIDTSQAVSMKGMFQNCPSLVSVPPLATSRVTNMDNMFQGCASLTAAPVMDTSSVTTMANMFNKCASLTSVPAYNTSKVTSMAFMFASCAALREVPLMDTSSVTTMANMFQGCSSLRRVPAFNTSKVTSMASMFQLCTNLEAVPLFDTSKVTSANYMLASCLKVQEIPAFDLSKLSGTHQQFCSGMYSLRKVHVTGVAVRFGVVAASMTAEALNEVFTNLAPSSSQIIDVMQNPGSNTCNVSIATAKGWRVNITSNEDDDPEDDE